jgi:hypothetical protein
MIPGAVWLIKLIVSHLLTDFVLQPKSWVEDRTRRHFASRKLYLHALENSLANAGKWIGILERVIVLILVILNQYSAIGLVIAAKSVLRFNEKDRQEAKTEYVLIGTLLSIGLAILTGLLVKGLM